jgi:hypothetical protein
MELTVAEVLVLILAGIVGVGGLYRIVWDEIRQSRRADEVAQASAVAEADTELPSSLTDERPTEDRLEPHRRTISEVDSRQGSSSIQ